MKTEIPQGSSGWQLVNEQLLGGLRDQDLPTVTGGQQPRTPIQRLAIVAALPTLGFARVKSDPGLEPCVSRPRLRRELALECQGTCGGVGGVVEDCQDTISRASCVLAMMALEAARHDAVVTGHRIAHAGR
jgi:hypothetical protein